MMLVPREVDARIFGGVAGALSRRGGDPNAFQEVRARYLRMPGGAVGLAVDAARRGDGSEVPVGVRLDLGQGGRPTGATGG